MKRAYQVWTFLCLVIVNCSLLLSACGQSSNQGSGIKSGGRVTIVPSPIGKFKCSFNPFDTGGANSNCYGVGGLIYEPLLYTNLLNGQSSPWLAEEYHWSTDAKTLTLNLRKDVKWSDGQPFTSSDVAFTFDILHRFPQLDTKKIWKSLLSVSTPDTYTVVMTFAISDLTQLWFIGTKTYIAPYHIWKDISDPTTATLTNPVGTGPFQLSDYSPQSYTLKRNTSYWQPGKPYVDEVYFPAYDSNTGTSDLLSKGDLDWAGVYTDSIQNNYVKLDPANNHYWFPATALVTVGLNLTRKPFQSLDVRQAISLALDRDAVVNQAENGYTSVSSPTGIVLPGYQPYLDSQYLGLTFHQDIAKAKQLLATAGYTVGADGILVNASGEQLAFTFTTVDGWTDWVTAANLIATQLRAINIAVNVQKVPYSDFYSQQQYGTFDMTFISSSNTQGPSPFFNYNSILDSKFTAPAGQVAASNFVRWNDSATDTFLQQYRQAISVDDQHKAIKGIERIMVEQLPVIPLFNSYLKSEYSTTRFVGWPGADNPYAVPSPYTSPDIEVVLLNIHQR
jgi:peptide/nickel transport system substrate-binding protein